MNKTINLFKRNKSIIRTALPIFLELILSIMIGNTDQFMISSDQIAVNAIIQANTVINLLLIVFSVLSTASIILISQYRGANDKADGSKIYALSLYFNALISVGVSLTLYFLAEPIFHLMGVDPAVIPDAVTYMQWTGAFIAFQAIMSTFSAFLRANRLNVSSTVVTLIMNILNIVLNSLFLYVFNMGVMGVAIASTISRFIGLVVIAFIYYRKIGVSLAPKMLSPFPFRLLSKLLRIGLPSAGENLSYSFSQTVILVLINMNGVLQGNVKGYISNIVMVVYIFANGITQAMQVEEGEALGGKQYQEADQLVKDTLKMSLIVSLGMSLFILAIGYPLIRWLMATSSAPEEAAKLAIICLAIDVLLELGRAGNIVLVRALQTAGDINYPVILAIIFCWVVAVGGTYLFGNVMGLGVIGCWMAMALDEIGRCLIFIRRWGQGGWKNLSILDSGPHTMLKDKVAYK
jgi:putative MATE family efflux protein